MTICPFLVTKSPDRDELHGPDSMLACAILKENVFRYEQNCKHIGCRVDLLEIAAQQVDEHVGYDSEHNSVRDGVAQRHCNHSDECRDGLGVVAEINVLDRSHHKHTHDNQYRCSGRSGDGEEDRGEEECDCKAKSRNEGSQTAASSLCDS